MAMYSGNNDPFGTGIPLYSGSHPVNIGGGLGNMQTSNTTYVEIPLKYHVYFCIKCGHQNKHYNNEEKNYCQLCNEEHEVNHP